MTYLVHSLGIGIGDPELITLRAKRILEESDLVFVPQSSKQGKSVAREIVRHFITDDKICLYYFPMNNNREELSVKYNELARQMIEKCSKGMSICYVTMGDPTIFSTSIYLTERLTALGARVCHTPGISTMNAASTRLGLPLCVKGENLGVYEMPEEVDKAIELIRSHSTTVFMKVNKKLSVLTEAVARSNPEIAYLARRLGLDQETVFDLRQADDPPDTAYLSIAIIKQHANPFCPERMR